MGMITIMRGSLVQFGKIVREERHFNGAVVSRPGVWIMRFLLYLLDQLLRAKANVQRVTQAKPPARDGVSLFWPSTGLSAVFDAPVLVRRATFTMVSLVCIGA